jgi:hypothetical protein
MIALLVMASFAGLWGALLFLYARNLAIREKAGPAGNFVFSGLLAIFLLSTALFGFEIYFRYFYDRTDSYGVLKTTDAWFKRHYQNNRMGVRDNIEYPVKKQDGRLRVVFLGDSFTAGHGVKDVEKRFANRIRKMRPEWEIHAIAVNGFDTGEEIRVLGEAFQQGYEADAVVLIYCLNDISDIIPPWQESLNRIYEDFSKTNILIRESFALNHFYYRLQRSSSPELRGYYSFVREAYGGEVWEEQKKRLRLFRDVLAYRGVKLLVVTFPFLQEIGPDYSYREIHQKIGEFWKESGVPSLDLLFSYEAFDPKQLVVSRFDAHPNEFAHELAAKRIDEFLKKEIPAA